METFTFCPAPGATKTINPKVRSAQFGDGYNQRVGDGINTMPRVWDVSFTRKEADIDLVDAFLTARAGVESFIWTPPEGTQGIFKCTSWARSLPTVAVQSISAQFIEVFGE